MKTRGTARTIEKCLNNLQEGFCN